MDDPDFWEKWAKKADIDGDASEDVSDSLDIFVSWHVLIYEYSW